MAPGGRFFSLSLESKNIDEVIKFYLKDPSAVVETPIFATLYYQGTRLKFSISEMIHPQVWNGAKMCARSSVNPLHRDSLNERLRDIQSGVDLRLRQMLSETEEPSREMVRKMVRSIVRPARDEQSNLIGFIERFILEKTSQRASETIKAYKNSEKRLKAFVKHQRMNPEVRDVDLDFYNLYVEYLTRAGYSKNTIGKQVKQLKVFVNEAAERGLRVSHEVRSRRFKVLQEETEHVYLSERELKKIYAHDFTKNPRLGRVRDLFLVGCYTGLRFSDLSSLKPENIIDDRFLKVRTQKTDQMVIIPLHPIVLEVLETYDGRLPDNISNQKMNLYLKEICEAVKINQPIVQSITRGNIRKEEILPKFKLITSHTARRSFATNAFLSGVPTISIMKITGHRTERAFMRYIKISEQENADKLSAHDFFK